MLTPVAPGRGAFPADGRVFGPTARRVWVGERGAALVVALLLTLLLTVVGGLLAIAMSTEQLIAAHDGGAEELLHAADAGLDRALLELARLPSWSAVLDGRASSRARDATLSPRLPDGRVVSLAELTAALQADADRGPWGPDNPRWRLFVFGPLGSLAGLDELDGPPWPYVVVWVADDHADGDGNPRRDTNGTLALRSEAFGARHGRRALEMTVTRPGPFPAPIRVLSWRMRD